MPEDLSHIDRQIRKNEIDAKEHQRRADIARATAASRQNEGTGAEGAYFEQEAIREDQKARALDDENERLQSAKAEAENKLNDLHRQRETLENEHNAKLKELDREIERTRGSSLSL